MKILRSPVFIICCLLFIAHQILQKVAGLSLPFPDSYLDSFLAMPIILSLLILERRLLFNRGKNYRLSTQEVFFATVFVALVSEILFPALSDEFTSDWLDVLFYTAGSLLFLFSINRSSANEKSKRKSSSAP